MARALIAILFIAAVAGVAVWSWSVGGRAAEVPPNWDSLRPIGGAYLLTFLVRSDNGSVNYVTIPGIATQAECDRLAAEMLTKPDRAYACHAYQIAH